MSTSTDLPLDRVRVEMYYKTLTEEMQMLADLHKELDSEFALGALMALSWMRDGTRSPTSILRHSDLSS